MRDYVLLGGLVVFFALAFTMHVLIAAGLVRRKKGVLALVSFVLPPAAPAIALRERMFVRGAISVVSLVGYVVVFVLSR